MSAIVWYKYVLLLLVLPLAAFLTYLFLTPQLPQSSSSRKSVIVQVTGHDFQWSFRYPGADGKLGTPDDVRLNRLLILPPNVDVTLLLTSEDYIYLFSLPPYGLREIAVPDLTHKLLCHTTTVKEFDLMVDPLCGFRFYHDEVMGHVSIAPLKDFNVWFGPSNSSNRRS